MIKTKEPVTTVYTSTEVDGSTRVTNVNTEIRTVYEYPRKKRMEVNYMTGKRPVFRNAHGNVIFVDNCRTVRAFSFGEFLDQVAARAAQEPKPKPMTEAEMSEIKDLLADPQMSGLMVFGIASNKKNEPFSSGK